MDGSCDRGIKQLAGYESRGLLYMDSSESALSRSLSHRRPLPFCLSLRYRRMEVEEEDGGCGEDEVG